MASDYYTILGIGRDASDKDVRQAYRRLARKYHPDINRRDRDAEEKFKEINAAYEVLSDPDKRKKYDQFGDNWRYADRFASAGGPTRGQPFFWHTTTPGGAPFDMDDLGATGFGSIINDLLTGRQRGGHRTATRSMPVEVPVELSLEEAYSGVTRIVQIPAAVVGQDRRLEVKIPPGVDTGSRIHVPAGGEVDLYLVVTVMPHQRFTRKGADLYMELSVPLVEAILGGEQEVQTLRSKVVLGIPKESQNGQVFRLRNQGMPRLGNQASTGDLFLTLKVVLPTNLSERERLLFQELSQSRGGRSGRS